MNEVFRLIEEPLRTLYVEVSAFLPRLLAMCVIILAGIVSARIVRFVLARLLNAISFDSWSDRMGFTSMLRKGDFWSKPSSTVAGFLFWLVILVAFLTGMSALHIRVIDELIGAIVGYLPRIVSAVMILVLGYVASGFLSRGLLISLVNSGFHAARQYSRIARGLLIVLILAMALEQLQVAPGVVIAAFSIIFGGIVLALAISFGVAGVDHAKKMLDEQSDRKNMPADDIQHV